VGKEYVSQAYSADSLRHRMEANVFLVSATGEEILGFADFHRLSETAVELAAIYVLPEMQGRGDRGSPPQRRNRQLPTPYGLMLRVEQDNTRARCFYEAHGFRHTGEYAEEFYGHIIHKLEMILPPPDSAPRTVSAQGRIWR
jgi:GNAT superfamily N-acetyltransferase